MTGEEQEKKLRDIGSQLSEFFPDYLIIVRAKDGMNWLCSDQNWAFGAASRTCNRLAEIAEMGEDPQ